MFGIGVMFGVGFCWVLYTLFAPQQLEFTKQRMKMNLWFRQVEYVASQEVLDNQLEGITNDNV